MATNNSVYVFKWGGAALAHASIAHTQMLFKEIAQLHTEGLPIVIVHGGGHEITGFCQQLQIPVQFHNGLRVTDAATLEVAKMLLLGKINSHLVNALNQCGVKAVGISGIDAGFLRAVKIKSAEVDYGFVGEITQVNTQLLNHLLAAQFVPVIAPFGTDEAGQIYNINADSVAGAIASHLYARKLIMISDVDGFYADANNPHTLLHQIELSQLHRWLKEEKVTGGMLPKMQASLQALQHGVPCVQIINGNTPNSLLAAVTDQDIGTSIFTQLR